MTQRERNGGTGPGGGRRKQEEQHSYNSNSLLQLVGNGPLGDAQKSALTEEERRNLEGN